MKVSKKSIIAILLLVSSCVSFAQKQKAYNAIYSGVPWFHDRGNVVSADGACIGEDKNRAWQRTPVSETDGE